MSEPWLLVIDAQRIFASPDSAWGSPMWGDVVEPVRRLAVPADDPLLDLVEPVRDLGAHVLSAPTFGKWGPDLTTLSGPTPDLVVAGVSTDCCVVSTALAAADAGATLTVVSDACAGSTADNHAAALHVMSLYPPQITVATTAEALT